MMIALVLTTVLSFQAGDKPLSVTELLDRWQAGVDQIQSYDLAIEYRSRGVFWTDPDGTMRLPRKGEDIETRVYHSRIFRDGEKRRGEFQNRSSQPNQGRTTDIVLICDGKEWFSQAPGANQYTRQAYATVLGNEEGEDYESHYRTLCGSFDRILESRRRKTRLLPREGNLYVLETPELSPKEQGAFPEFRWRVWLDPARNFLPVRLTLWIVKSGRPLHSFDQDVELKEVLPGVWAPVRVIFKNYNKSQSSNTFGQCMANGELRVLLDQSRFNVPLAASLFDTTIPTGGLVVDRVRNVNYTEGSTDPDKFLEHLAEQGRKGVLEIPAAEKGLPPMVVIPDTRFLYVLPVSIFLGAVTVTLGLFWFLRRRSRKAGEA